MTAQTVQGLSIEIYRLMQEIGEMITKAPDRTIADEMFSTVRKELTNHTADYIWDYIVDWGEQVWE